MAESAAVIDTGALYAKLNSQIEELKTLIGGHISTKFPPDLSLLESPKLKKKRAKPNLSPEQINVLKERLVKAREAKKAKRLAA